MLKSAVSTWKAGDTAATINHLKNFYRSYPDNWTSAMVCLRLGRLYVAMNKKDAARLVLNEGLETGREWMSVYPDSTGLFLSPSGLTVWKAWSCILLSELARESGDNRLSLQYLLLADTKYVPYWTCGTGMQAFREELSPEIADAYLRLGDTSNAINHLLKYFIYDQDAVVKLKPLLLTKYTQEQINNELDRAIAASARVITGPGPEKNKLFVFKVFNREVTRDSYSGYKYFRKYLDVHPRIKYLRN